MKNLKSLSLLFFMLIIIAFSLALVRQRQETRKGAEDFGDEITMGLSPSEVKINKNETFDIKLDLNTPKQISGFELIFCYSKKLELVEFQAYGSTGMSKIYDRDAYHNFPENKVGADRKCSYVFVTGKTLDLPVGKLELAKITFKALEDHVGFINISNDVFKDISFKGEIPQDYRTLAIESASGKLSKIKYVGGEIKVIVGDSTTPPVANPTWTNWSDCTVACGGGVRTRKCVDSTGKEVSGCDGFSSENCNTHACGGVGDVNVSMDVAFMGVQTGECFDKPEVNVEIVYLDGANEARETRKVVAVQTNDSVRYDIYDNLKKYKVNFSLGSNFIGKDVAFLVKGPRHLKTKYGINDQSSSYGELKGKIRINSGSNNFNFSKYPMLAGDVAGGIADGKIDGADFSYMKTQVNLGKNGNKIVDLNGDCAIGSPDLIVFLKSLIEKQDQLY